PPWPRGDGTCNARPEAPMPAEPLVLSLDEFRDRVTRHAPIPRDALLRKAYASEVKQLDDAARTIQFTISTGAVDRDADTLAPDGWQLDAYRKNPVVLWAHDYRQPPVAKCEQAWI